MSTSHPTDVTHVMNALRPSLSSLLFRFRVLSSTKTEEQKRRRPGNEANLSMYGHSAEKVLPRLPLLGHPFIRNDYTYIYQHCLVNFMPHDTDIKSDVFPQNVYSLSYAAREIHACKHTSSRLIQFKIQSSLTVTTLRYLRGEVPGDSFFLLWTFVWEGVLITNIGCSCTSSCLTSASMAVQNVCLSSY